MVSCTILCILKGYRDAQVVWCIPPCRISARQESNTKMPPTKSECTDANTTQKAIEPQHRDVDASIVLVIYAPRRGTIEAWHHSGSFRLGSLPGAPLRGVLLAQPSRRGCGVLNPQRISGKKEHLFTACWLLDLEHLVLKDLSFEIAKICV